MKSILWSMLILGATPLFADEGLFEVGQLPTKFDQIELARATYQLISANTGVGYGSLVFVSPEGHFLTSRHLIDDIIDRHLETTGLVFKNGFEGLETPLVLTGDADRGTSLPSLRNATTGEWTKPAAIEIPVLLKPMRLRNLRDVVLGRVDFRPSHWIRRFARRPARVGETVYALGYPMESQRTLASRKASPLGFYENSSGSEPRVSVGKVGARRGVFRLILEDGFTSDADGLQGSSGSATFNEDGELLGFLSGAWRGLHWARYNRRATGEAFEPNVPTIHVDLARTLLKEAPRGCEVFLGPSEINSSSKI